MPRPIFGRIRVIQDIDPAALEIYLKGIQTSLPRQAEYTRNYLENFMYHQLKVPENQIESLIQEARKGGLLAEEITSGGHVYVYKPGKNLSSQN